MMVLAYAHAKLAGDSTLIQQYYPTFLGWANELAGQTLYPTSQVSTDDFEGADSNYTSLALKGLCGIQAMARMSALVGETADADNFTVSYIEFNTAPRASLNLSAVHREQLRRDDPTARALERRLPFQSDVSSGRLELDLRLQSLSGPGRLLAELYYVRLPSATGDLLCPGTWP